MFISLLTVLFIGLKLAGIISWSWVWVLAPLWAVALFFGVALFIIWLGKSVQSGRIRKNIWGKPIRKPTV